MSHNYAKLVVLPCLSAKSWGQTEAAECQHILPDVPNVPKYALYFFKACLIINEVDEFLSYLIHSQSVIESLE